MAEAAASVSALMASWFTPSSLFIFVNLVIGTIAITSRFGAPRRQIHEPELAPHNSPRLGLVRSPSLLDRVRSFNLAYYNHQPTLAETECTEPQLVRTPSLLERLKSFNFGLYNYNYEPSHAEIEHVQPDQPEFESPCPNAENQQGPQLARAPSLLQRLQSMNFLRLYRSDSMHAEKETEPEPEMEGPDSDPGENVVERSKAEKMRKSASERSGSRKWEEDEGAVERRRPATARTETASLRVDEEVDAKADDFINRFKKQLRLQRIDSILRYREICSKETEN